MSSSGVTLHRSDQANDGFSLIEVLVTLALVSIISVLLIASFAQLRSIFFLTLRSDAELEVTALTNYFGATLERVRFLPLFSEKGGMGASLVGTTRTVKFVGIDRIGSEDFALRDIHFLTRRGRAGLELIQASYPRRASATNSPLITPLAEIDDVEFQYRADDGWRRDWSEARPPLAVKVTVSLTRKGQRVAATKTVMLQGL